MTLLMLSVIPEMIVCLELGKQFQKEENAGQLQTLLRNSFLIPKPLTPPLWKDTASQSAAVSQPTLNF